MVVRVINLLVALSLGAFVHSTFAEESAAPAASKGDEKIQRCMGKSNPMDGGDFFACLNEAYMGQGGVEDRNGVDPYLGEYPKSLGLVQMNGLNASREVEKLHNTCAKLIRPAILYPWDYFECSNRLLTTLSYESNDLFHSYLENLNGDDRKALDAACPTTATSGAEKGAEVAIPVWLQCQIGILKAQSLALRKAPENELPEQEARRKRQLGTLKRALNSLEVLKKRQTDIAIVSRGCMFVAKGAIIGAARISRPETLLFNSFVREKSTDAEAVNFMKTKCLQAEKTDKDWRYLSFKASPDEVTQGELKVAVLKSTLTKFEGEFSPHRREFDREAKLMPSDLGIGDGGMDSPTASSARP